MAAPFPSSKLSGCSFVSQSAEQTVVGSSRPPLLYLYPCLSDPRPVVSPSHRDYLFLQFIT